MLLEDVFALVCVISFGGWIVSCYYIWKYSKTDDTKSLQSYEQSQRTLETLKLQRKIAGIVAIISFVLFNLVYEKNPAPEVVQENQPVEVQNVEPVNSNEKQVEKNSDFYPPGQLKVGADIPAGEYLVIGEKGYVEVMPDSSGDISKIIMNDNFKNRHYVLVYEGEYLKVTGDLKIYPVDKAPKENFDTKNLPEGQYKIGVDIPEGEYKVIGDEYQNGYFEVGKGTRGANDRITNNFMQKNTSAYITVRNGQYLNVKNAVMQLQ